MNKKKFSLPLFLLLSLSAPIKAEGLEEFRDAGVYLVELNGDFTARHNVTLGVTHDDSDAPFVKITATDVEINTSNVSQGICKTTIGNSTTGGKIELVTSGHHDIKLEAAGANLLNATNGTISNNYVTFKNVTAVNSTIYDNTTSGSGSELTLENFFLVNSDVPADLIATGGQTYKNVISLMGTIPTSVADNSIIIGRSGDNGGEVALFSGTGDAIDLEGGATVKINATSTAETHIGGFTGHVKIGYGTGEVHIGNESTGGENTISIGGQNYSGSIHIGNQGGIGRKDPKVFLNGDVTVNSNDLSNGYMTLNNMFMVNNTVQAASGANEENPLTMTEVVAINSDIPSSLAVEAGGSEYKRVVLINGQFPTDATPTTINNSVIIGEQGSTGGRLYLYSGAGKSMTIFAGNSANAGNMHIDGANIYINNDGDTAGKTFIGGGNGDVTIGDTSTGDATIDVGTGSFFGTVNIGNVNADPAINISGVITLAGGPITIKDLGEPVGGTVYALAVDSEGVVYRTGISAKKYKTNITNELPSTIDSFYRLQPCQYSYKTTPEVVEYGFIADDLAAKGILAETVRFNEKKEPEAIHYQSIFVIAVGELIKVKKELDAVKNDHNALKKDFNALEAKYDQLKKIVDALSQIK